jgi:pimeloyl-ACP methyl ester carboxylesterase
MTRRFLAHLLVCLCGALAATSALAARAYDEATIRIDGKPRRYYHLHDSDAEGKTTPIVLVSGSGCRDFASRVPSFFEHYPAPVDLYFLEKVGIEKGDDGEHCSETYNREDVLERRVGDTLSFIDIQPRLHSLAPRSLAIVGFSEGGTVAPLAAARSAKIGWLAVVGSGGLPQSEEFLVFAGRGVAPYATLFSRAQFLQTYAAIKADPDSLDKEFFGHPYRYWSSHLFYDPLLTYAKLDIPVVVAMGEKDDSVPIESGRKLHVFFESHPGNKFTFVEYPDAGHALQAPERNYLPKFIAGLAGWFKGQRNPF